MANAANFSTQISWCINVKHYKLGNDYHWRINNAGTKLCTKIVYSLA